jgi:hypothetical protein
MANDGPRPSRGENAERAEAARIAPTQITIASDPAVETVIRQQPEEKSRTAESPSEEPKRRENDQAQGHDEPERAEEADQPAKRDAPPADRADARAAAHRDTRDGGRGADHDRGERPPPPRSTMKSLLATGAVALVCGVIGAMGYSYFFGPKPQASASTQSGKQAGSKGESAGKSQDGAASKAELPNEASTMESSPSASAMPGEISMEDAETLNQQLAKLTARIDRLGERVDRLQELLGLAVPLLQRLAPKTSSGSP